MSANSRGGPDKDESCQSEVAYRKSIHNNLDWLRDNLLPVRVIYTDLDGTMVGPLGCFFRDSADELTLRPARALLSAHACDVDITLVSGRHKSQLRETARLLGCMNYVAELGCELVYGLGREVVLNIGELEIEGESVYRTILDTGVVELLLGAYERRLEMHTPWSDERDCTPLLRGWIDINEARALLGEHGFSQFDIIDNGVIPRKSPTLDVPETRAYHIVPRGVSKALAVEKDRQYRGFRREETVAVGDAEADLPLASAVGALFLVRNGLDANPQLAQQVDATENVFVTEERMGDGWAEVTETLLSLLDE
ncbi:MAG: haloacid dehalogenase [Candidatus Anoxymicrobium japonicum]|uniref:Haloacid dehalogenase n=1 Tax=Candidatus Anoxymicrobium japonicum TaxID=2013648 RepID=A0A2N3G578_9ACTN|nr:MAG: haloacid dehalogenase [Candidatus Anoxymicrobium japonicum]